MGTIKEMETIRQLRREEAYCYLKCKEILLYSISQEDESEIIR